MQLDYDILAVTLFLRSSLLLFTNLWVLKALDYENKDLFRLLFKILKSERHYVVIFFNPSIFGVFHTRSLVLKTNFYYGKNRCEIIDKP